MKKLSPTEYEECLVFADYLRLKNLKFTHIANESGLPPRVAMIVGAKKKKMGVSRGVPDFMVITPQGLVFVEMKRVSGGRASPEQLEWIDALNKLDGVEAKICKGAEIAIAFIEEFLK